MVNRYGVWTPEENYTNFPKEKWCELDYIANEIAKRGYEVKTNIELMCMLIVDMFYKEANGKSNVMDNIEEVVEFVELSGGFAEFDHFTKEFQINISETLLTTVTVEAETWGDAYMKAQEMYKNEEVVLTAADHFETTFELLED